jgi:glycosyltransferase involved in cell wall biosynthesis
MRILFLIDTLGTGGTERSLVELLGPLTSLGVEPTVVTLAPGYQLEAEARARGVPVLDAGARTAAGSVLNVARIIRQVRPELIHTALFKSDVRGRIAAIRSGAVVISSLVNSTYEPVRLLDPNVRRTTLEAARVVDGWTGRHLCDHFHAVSESTKESAVRRLHLSPESITVIPRGRDPHRLGAPGLERRDRARHGLDLEQDDEVILSIGRHEYQKDHECLVAAVAGLQDRPRLKVLIAGRTGHATASIEAAVAANGLGNRVRLLGHRDDIPELLAAADVLVSTSTYEGMPGAVIEGMALGLPIVATTIPPVLEVVEPDANARLFSPGDATELARVLAELLGDDATRQHMGGRSREIFLDRFTLSASAKHMSGLYAELLARAGGRSTSPARSGHMLTPPDASAPAPRLLSTRMGPAVVKRSLVARMRKSWLRSSHRVRLTRDLTPQIRKLKGVVLDVGGGREAPLDAAWPLEVIRYRVDAFPHVQPRMVGDATMLPIRAGSVDGVVMCELLEHIEQPALAIAEARRVLRAGGVLCGSVPFLFPVHGDPHDFWRYTESALRSLLADAQFHDVMVKAHGNRFTAAWTLICGSSTWARLLNPLVRRCFPGDSPQAPEGYVFTAVA